MRILTDIAVVIGIICFVVFIVDLFVSEKISFGIPAIIIFGICLILFLFSKDKKNAFVDIWNFLEILYDIILDVK